MKPAKLIYCSLACLLLFILVLVGIYYGNILKSWDLSVNSLMASIQISSMVSFSKVISIIFDTNILLPIALIVAAYIWFRSYRKESIFLAITMLIGAAATFVIKDIVQRIRPSNGLINESTFSFPSGHAEISVIFFGLISYLIWQKSKSKALKSAVLVLSVLMMLIIGFSRLYLNVHWLSDVIGGFALGAFVLIGSIFIKEHFEKK